VVTSHAAARLEHQRLANRRREASVLMLIYFPFLLPATAGAELIPTLINSRPLVESITWRSSGGQDFFEVFPFAAKNFLFCLPLRRVFTGD
jgi:hypothetical protein